MVSGVKMEEFMEEGCIKYGLNMHCLGLSNFILLIRGSEAKLMRIITQMSLIEKSIQELNKTAFNYFEIEA